MKMDSRIGIRVGINTMPIHNHGRTFSERRLPAPWRINPYKQVSTDNTGSKIQDENQAVLRIHDILMWIRIRIRGSMPLTNGSVSWIRILDTDPAFFVIDRQDANKKLIKKIFCFLLFEGISTSFFKYKKSK
jgi:hypothetical protein